jgi:hypothetical protein
MTEEQQEAITRIADACTILGWDISFDGSDDVEGMVIGTPRYINWVLGTQADGDTDGN